MFISGCKALLVLPGQTYSRRLWCVIEIFCFLRMGGALDRITVVPVLEAAGGAESRDSSDYLQAVEASRARFAQFDVERARCAKEEDTQRLLAVIETGFGTYEPFNQLVRQTFEDRAEYSVLEPRRTSRSKRGKKVEGGALQKVEAPLPPLFAPSIHSS